MLICGVRQLQKNRCGQTFITWVFKLYVYIFVTFFGRIDVFVSRLYNVQLYEILDPVLNN